MIVELEILQAQKKQLHVQECGGILLQMRKWGGFCSIDLKSRQSESSPASYDKEATQTYQRGHKALIDRMSGYIANRNSKANVMFLDVGQGSI